MIGVRKNRAFVLLEVIVSIVLFSILSLGTIEFIFSLRQKNIQTTDMIVQTLKLESTRLFLIHQKQLDLLILSDNSLYFNGDLLLNKVSKYGIQMTGHIATIEICTLHDTICQTWKIRI